ncbi:MAG: phenylalanine--tRNA ligase subunit beta [Actinomycetota bacterium]
MRIVRSWLTEFVDTDMSAEELAELLAEKGLHLEAIERPWDGLEGVVVARVLDVRDHPGSDHLCLSRVQTGSGELEVVVGVRNIAAGDLVPLAPPGARVPTLDGPLTAREIRGVVSNGMLCSPRELGIADVHTGILILGSEAGEVGGDLKTALGLDEAVLDLEIESNRPDLLGVIGVAREVAAATGAELHVAPSDPPEADEDAETVATVEVKDPDLCPRYMARVIRGLGAGTTPLRVQARLTAAGLRPISPAVDATNYAMLERGQPMHAFDLHRTAGPGIVVRRASPGEPIVTLDDVERSLEADDLLICDRERPVGIAGVMGGATSEVADDTRDVLLESAYFSPRAILRTSRRLNLLTEASIRFSRGTDPEGVGDAATRCAELMIAWSGAGSVLRGAIDVGAAPPRRRATLRASRATRLLGYQVTPAAAADALVALGVPASADGDVVSAEVPGFRPDLVEEVDLIEEVVRFGGYGRLPATLPAIRQAGGEQGSYALRRRIRSSLMRAGLREATSLSFASEEQAAWRPDAEPVRLTNPPAGDLPCLRTSLVPALLDAAARNLDRGTATVALFEVGHVFRLGDPVDERESVAVVLAGREEGLYGGARVLDVLDAKGAVEALMEGLGIPDWALGDRLAAPFHPGRSAEIAVGDAPVGRMGELLPSRAAALGIEARGAVVELDASALAERAGAFGGYRGVSRFPPVRRDLAFLLDEHVPAAAVRLAISQGAGELLDRVVLFDVFRGGGLGEGKKSLAFSLDLRARDRTLEGSEADAVVARIVERVAADVGGELRTSG